MPNIGALLKEEIARVCRKEIRREVEPVRKTSATYRREIAALKRQVAALERQAAVLARRTAKAAPETTMADPDRPMRFVAKGLVSLRARLGLSAEDFGRLVGVSGQSIYNWEKGKTVPRKEQLTALASLRGIGKREAAARLEALG
jgi:DNA-binding transcriptional regulator YiaG